MEVLSKQEAKQEGLRFYFTGKACKRGHVDQRTVSSSDCLSCKKDREKKWFEDNPDYVDTWSNEQKENRKQRNKVNNKNHYMRNKDDVSYKARKLAATVKYNLMKKRAVPLWFEDEAVEDLYEECRVLELICAAYGEPVKFEADHIVPIQSDKVCGLHCHANLQILTKEANCSKSNRFEV